jgi:hypothetical protein
VNCTPVPCAPSHTEIGNFPQPRPWNKTRANLKPPVRPRGYFAGSMKEAEMSIFDEQYRVIAIESDRLLVRGIRSGDVLTIINTEPETPLTEADYPPGRLVALTDPSTAPLN